MLNGNIDLFDDGNGNILDINDCLTVFDNGGATFDRYTVFFASNFGLNLSFNADSAGGVCNFIESDLLYSSLAQEAVNRYNVKIAFADLPDGAKYAARYVFNEFLHDDFYETEEGVGIVDKETLIKKI